MRVNIVRGQVKKCLEPRQSGCFLYSSGLKTRSVARLVQEMIRQQSLIFLKPLQLQCAYGNQVHNFHQDPSPVTKSITQSSLHGMTPNLATDSSLEILNSS